MNISRENEGGYCYFLTDEINLTLYSLTHTPHSHTHTHTSAHTTLSDHKFTEHGNEETFHVVFSARQTVRELFILNKSQEDEGAFYLLQSVLNISSKFDLVMFVKYMPASFSYY